MADKEQTGVGHVEPVHIHKALTILTTSSTAEKGVDASFSYSIEQVVKYLQKLISTGIAVHYLLHCVDAEYGMPCKLDEVLQISRDDLISTKTEACHSDDTGLSDDVMVCGKLSENEARCRSKNDISVNDNGGSLVNVGTGSNKDSQDVRWEYVKCNLKLLLCLKLSIQSALKRFNAEAASQEAITNPEYTAPPLAPDILSFEQQKVIMTSLQFIACLGVCPHLIRGVGIPVVCRSEFGGMLSGVPERHLSVAEREFQMWVCVSVLLDCMQQPVLGSLILTRHLNDILAALLQITHAPRKLNTSSQTTKTAGKHADISTDRPATCQSETSTLEKPQVSKCKVLDAKCLSKEQIRIEAALKLQEILTRVYQPAVVKELLLLQGGAPTSAKHQQLVVQKRPPRWLCQICSCLLTDCLLRPHGVQSVLRAILETSNLDAGHFDWKKCDAAARILAAAPIGRTSQLEDYYKIVGPQIVELLESKDKLMMAVYVKVASKAILIMYNNHRELTEKYILSKTLEPLYRCSQDVELNVASEPVTFVTESDLQHSIQCVYKVFVLGSDPDSAVIQILGPCIDVLLHLFAFCRSGVSFLRKPAEEIVINYLKQCDAKKAVSVLSHFVLADNSNDYSVKRMNKRLMFVAGSEGGVVIQLRPEDDCSLLLGDRWEMLSTAAVHLLKSISSDELTAEFFLHCLMLLTQIVHDEVSKEMKEESLLSVNDSITHLCSSLTVLDILSKILETFGYTCLMKNTMHIVNFVKITLERCIQVLNHTEDVTLGMFESETVTMAMGLLAAVIDSDDVQMTSDDYDSCQDLLPLLHHLASTHSDPFMQQMATDLRIAIATRGHLKPDPPAASVKHLSVSERRQADVCGDEKTKPNSKTELDEEQSVDTSCSDDGRIKDLKSNPVSTGKGHNKENINDSEDVSMKDQAVQHDGESMHTNQSLDDVFRDLRDPMIPIKGHALIALRRLILNKDQKALQKWEEILKIFQDHLRHPDTYIYLAAIQGLSSVAVMNTDHVINILVEEYVDDHNSKVKAAELRMKIGEVIVKTIAMLGEMIPKYRDLLLRAFLHTARDQDHHLRSSSLSNLGELCALLRYSLGSHVYEILNCVESLIRGDPEVEVRRAAAMFVHRLLEGLGQDTLKILADSLKDLYRLLKMTLTSEKDDVTILHTRLALTALDDIMRKFIFPDLKLEKKLHILSAPPN